jgi:hypothetical protein
VFLVHARSFSAPVEAVEVVRDTGHKHGQRGPDDKQNKIGLGQNACGLQFNAIQFNSVQVNPIQFNSIQFSSSQSNSIKFISVQFNSIHYFFIGILNTSKTMEFFFNRSSI